MGTASPSFPAAAWVCNSKRWLAAMLECVGARWMGTAYMKVSPIEYYREVIQEAERVFSR